jgi:hypothetical protein
LIARRDHDGTAALAMSFAEEIELELTRRFDAASRLVEDARVADVAAAEWFAMQMEIQSALRDAVIEVARKLDDMA